MSKKRTRAEKQRLFIQIMAVVLCLLMLGSTIALLIPFIL